TGGSNNLTSNTMTYNGRTQQMFGLSGVLQDNKLNYNLTQGWKNQGVGSAVNLNLNYLSSYANMNGNYLYQQDVRQWSYGINGGITLHENGITLSQPLSLNGSAALVRAEDASDVKVLNNSSIYTDWRGYAVVPSLSAYNRNQISLDVNTLGDDAELQNTDVTVIPSRGALVAADFRVNIGNKAMITLLQKNGKPIPFGSLVSLISKNKTNTGIVADLGQVYMSGLPSHGVLNVKWGETDENECKVGFNLKKSVNKYSEITLRCN
ncbi:fimbrial biogenesis outer membrane usher protein, partial [Escherichia coli]|nr:fimbrial biogenesis outer membrane usher protein [Escherichia coli]